MTKQNRSPPDIYQRQADDVIAFVDKLHRRGIRIGGTLLVAGGLAAGWLGYQGSRVHARERPEHAAAQCVGADAASSGLSPSRPGGKQANRVSQAPRCEK